MLSAHSLTKSFATRPVLHAVSFALPVGETLAVLGASGSGKSTLLAVLAGLEAPESGTVQWAGEDVTRVPPQRRGFGLMFQDYALFPHRNVAENVAFGLRMHRWARAARETQVQAMLQLVGLTGLAKRDVSTLSGGEQQRVALARALAPRPRVLLLDEPLGALDRAWRERLLGELRAILHTLHQTALYVTHDADEAFALADQLLVLQNGRVAQSGPPAEVYAQPASRAVAELLGLNNFLPVLGQSAAGVVTPFGPLPLPAMPTSTGWLLLRPTGAQLVGAAAAHFSGRVVEVLWRAGRPQLRLAPIDSDGASTVQLELAPTASLPASGTVAHWRLLPDALSWLAE